MRPNYRYLFLFIVFSDLVSVRETGVFLLSRHQIGKGKLHMLVFSHSVLWFFLSKIAGPCGCGGKGFLHWCMPRRNQNNN
uniref:Uncharacterized protein n=1 Tax=Solanum tuberosum TaxID=4113 RepID=M1CSZ8_SOLTU